MTIRPNSNDGVYVLSYGGGVNTTALMIYLIKKEMPLDMVVFADLGSELPETYEHLEIAKDYLEKHGIPFKVIKVDVAGGGLYEGCERRKVIPSQLWRWCTRDYKVKPIFRFYKSLGTHVYQYLGIDYGEIQRVKKSTESYVTNLFPLVDAKIDRKGCIDLINKEGLPVPVKSGCFFCPFNNLDRWEYIYKNHKDLFDRAIRLEENSKHFPEQKLNAHPLRELNDSFSNGRFILEKEKPEDNLCDGYCML